MALSPADIRYAQEVGEYALMGCALTWMLYVLDDALESSRWNTWGLWGFLATVSIYSHYGAGIVVVALASISLMGNLWRREISALSRQSVVLMIVLPLWSLLFLHFLPKQLGGMPRDVSPIGPLGAEFKTIIRSAVNSSLFTLTGWPYSRVPGWIGEMTLLIVGVIVLLMFVRSGKKVPTRPLVWLLGSYLLYYAMVRVGLYGYGNYGFRHALVLSPLVVLTMAAAVEWLFRNNRARIALGLLIVVLGMELFSLPNRTWSQHIRGNMAWPEREDLDRIVPYWLDHRSDREATYVYYGAAPAFRYYLRLYGVESGPLPPGWYARCWDGKSQGACVAGNIYYGEGLRRYPPLGKLWSVRETLRGEPERLWMIFSHVYEDEENVVLQELRNYGYTVALSERKVNASAYLLVRD